MLTRKIEYSSEEFESHVDQGMVIGINGEWCSIDEAINEENELSIHLENGEILHNGEWIPIVEAIANENKDIQSKPASLRKNQTHDLKKTLPLKKGIDKSSITKIKQKKDSDSQAEAKKTDYKNIHKVKKKKKILLADVNIKVDKAKKTDLKEDDYKPEVKLKKSKTPVSTAENNIVDSAMTQIIEIIPSSPKNTINNPSKPDFVSSEKTLIKKLSKEASTFDNTITQIIPLPIHIFRGKQINLKRKNKNDQMHKRQSLPKESLEEWARIRSNFKKITILFLASAILVVICFYFLYYFVLL